MVSTSCDLDEMNKYCTDESDDGAYCDLKRCMAHGDVGFVF